jgi:hypothetical protein
MFIKHSNPTTPQDNNPVLSVKPVIKFFFFVWSNTGDQVLCINQSIHLSKSQASREAFAASFVVS